MAKLTNDDIDKKMMLTVTGIFRIGEYVNAHTKITFGCKYGHTWDSIPNNVVNHKSGCPHCSGRYKPTKEEFNKSLIDNNRNITLIGEYSNKDTLTLFKCGCCGHQWKTNPNSIKRGHGCPKCVGQYSPTTEEFREWLVLNGKDIELIGEYKNAYTKTLFRGGCGHEWFAKPTHIKSGTGCAICNNTGFRPEKPAWEYILDFGHFLKFGITNNIKSRLKAHEKNGKYRLVHSKYHEFGQMALDWENQIKQTHGGRYVTKEECPDGYTETLPIEILESLIR